MIAVNKLCTIYHGDCLDVMPENVESESVDLVLVDPPYGTTACKWDLVIPLESMWEQIKRILSKLGTVVMIANQPFTTIAISSNMDMFKYCRVWEKSRPTGFLKANIKPLVDYEDIVIFSKGVCEPKSKNRMVYNPQGLIKSGVKNKRGKSGLGMERVNFSHEYKTEFTNYPRSIIKIPSVSGGLHPTQKPEALMEYMIKTYSNEGDTVLDFAMGSGTTGVAAYNLKRSFIGIEKKKQYFDTAHGRIKRCDMKLFKRIPEF